MHSESDSQMTSCRSPSTGTAFSSFALRMPTFNGMSSALDLSDVHGFSKPTKPRYSLDGFTARYRGTMDDNDETCSKDMASFGHDKFEHIDAEGTCLEPDTFQSIPVKVEEHDITLSKSRRRSDDIGRLQKKVRRDSKIEASSFEDMSHKGHDGRELYREKNRVAAAKCRAKRKGHTSVLEENHKTQSVLNTALKQMEQTLRVELSFLRTRALQHTFCNCEGIQDYNMRQAHTLACEQRRFKSGPQQKQH